MPLFMQYVAAKLLLNYPPGPRVGSWHLALFRCAAAIRSLSERSGNRAHL
jgi:hypothetical protein